MLTGVSFASTIERARASFLSVWARLEAEKDYILLIGNYLIVIE